MRMMLAVLALAATPAMADPLWEMCTGPGNQGPEQCDCIVAGLRNELSGSDHRLYTAVASRYLETLSAGKPATQAWEMAVQRESAEQKANFAAFSARVGELVEAHDAIRARCAGQ